MEADPAISAVSSSLFAVVLAVIAGRLVAKVIQARRGAFN
jgi:hypothetical protein